MYQSIQTEFEPKFKRTDLVFTDEYDKAYERVKHYPQDNQENAIRMILSEILAEYARSKPTTKGGRIGRWVARVFGVVVKVWRGW